jgi:hypothetical protein
MAISRYAMSERWGNTALEMPLNRNVCPPDCAGYFISAFISFEAKSHER